MQLNKNNFLVWSGTFKALPFTVFAADQTVSIVRNAPKIDIDPFIGFISTFGVNYLSFVVEEQPAGEAPVLFNSTTHLLTYILPINGPVATKTIKYSFRDQAGNKSNIGTITVNLTERPTAWRGYGQMECIKDSGQNTGMAVFLQLEKYFTDNNQPFLPQQLKPNTEGQPDYISPSSNLSLCPLPGSTVNMDFISFVNNGEIQYVTFFDAATAAYVIGFYVGAGQSNPRNYDVPVGTFNISVSVNFTGIGDTNLSFSGTNSQSVGIPSGGGSESTLNGCQIDPGGNNLITFNGGEIS